MVDLLKVSYLVPEIQRQVSRHHLNVFDGSFVLKNGGKDYTTDVDRIVEQELSSRLHEEFPGTAVLGEEETSADENSRFMWVIDPTDGTAVFATGGEYFSSSIALIDRENGTVPFGSVYQPRRGRQFIRNNLYCGAPDICVRLRIQVLSEYQDDFVVFRPERSQSSSMTDMLVCAVATSKYLPQHPGLKEKLDRLFRKERVPIIDREYGMINAKPASGSSALYLCDTASGNRHGAILYFQKAWDLAVGALFARDAGCVVTCSTKGIELEGEDIEKVIAGCSRNTLVNCAVYANQDVKNTVERMMNTNF
ncbi:hypothetical protein HY483_00685 [Candidatus Woesearchaeota archaeon]|nr:hypothetical protein [Candidatus Woesearchaeota archaeon]